MCLWGFSLSACVLDELERRANQEANPGEVGAEHDSEGRLLNRVHNRCRFEFLLKQR